MTLEYREKDGLLYPEVETEERTAWYGMYGRLRRNYLEQYRPADFMMKMLAGELEQHCLETEQEADELEQSLLRQMAERDRISEGLKAEDQLLWVQKMNLLREQVRETVLSQVVYR